MRTLSALYKELKNITKGFAFQIQGFILCQADQPVC